MVHTSPAGTGKYFLFEATVVNLFQPQGAGQNCIRQKQMGARCQFATHLNVKWLLTRTSSPLSAWRSMLQERRPPITPSCSTVVTPISCVYGNGEQGSIGDKLKFILNWQFFFSKAINNRSTHTSLWTPQLPFIASYARAVLSMPSVRSERAWLCGSRYLCSLHWDFVRRICCQLCT